MPKHEEIGIWVYTPTEYDWTARLIGSGMGAVWETVEEELLEFVHSDVSVTLADFDGAVSDVLMGTAPTAALRAEIWRNGHVLGSEVLLFGGSIDPASIEQDFRDQTVTFRILANSKKCDFTSAESVRRSIVSRTGSVVANTATVTVNNATDLEVDDTIELSLNGIKESHVVIQKAANVLTTRENWTNSFTNATLNLLTPYWRGKTPSFLATELYKAAGFPAPNVTAPDLSLDDPIPLRMNSAGLSRTGVNTVSRRGNNIAVFENGSSYYAANPTGGFLAASYTPPQPSDWSAYGGLEPSPHVSIGMVDNGTRVVGKSTTNYWYGRFTTTPGPTSTNFKLELVRNDGVAVLVNQQNYNNELGWSASFDYWVEYNAAENLLWISWQRWEIPDDPDLASVVASGCNAYTPAMVGSGTRPTAAARQLRSILNSRMVTYNDREMQLLNALSAYNVLLTFEYRSNVQVWTLRFIAFDSVQYLMGIRYYGTAWYLVVWNYATGAVIYEEQITSAEGAAPPAKPTAFGAIWYDSTGVDDVYVGYVPTVVGGGYYFFVSKAGTGTVEYADFANNSVSAALRKVAVAAGAVLYVSADNQAYFTPRSKLATVFGSTPTALATFYEKRKTNVWDWFRSSCAVKGRELAAESEFEVVYGDTGNKAYRLEVDADFVSSPAVARALAKSYVGFFNKTNGSFELEVDVPQTGPSTPPPLRPFKVVSFDSANHRIFAVRSNFLAKRVALTVVKE